ncbi:hypothetical protein [Actinacidiphila oryziradicis]|uniref:Uncharacterized protein n=1 Tax=Actinacidiphila oryziradicis TaxID=2571141 RepID=A0A4U0T6T2_9ACTN|nr:hypothetical protein [Actinacidiphila oryziradicis]TKA08565.1 hypothetical protein FCI23_26875 [Actinacidiphila oryziradicis]
MTRPLHQFLPAGITALGMASATLASSTGEPAIVRVLAVALAMCGVLLASADLYEASLQRDAAVVAHLAKNPGARTRHIGNALGIRDAVAARNLARRTKAGLIVRATENEALALQSFRLSA